MHTRWPTRCHLARPPISYTDRIDKVSRHQGREKLGIGRHLPLRHVGQDRIGEDVPLAVELGGGLRVNYLR
jgi:hypothetical protein